MEFGPRLAIKYRNFYMVHKDDHFTKKCKINLINYNKDMKSDSKNTL